MTDWVVLLVVLVILLFYVYRCNALRLGAGLELEDQEKDFSEDIVSRAKRGLDPDWHRYTEESERQQEYTSESLRNFATTALATGIGGTMSILFLHLTTAPESSDAIGTLLGAMGFALSASVLGVATNLAILIFILPDGNRRFDVKRGVFVRALRNMSRDHPALTPNARLDDTIGEKLDEVLERTAHNFPSLIRGFQASVASLDRIATTFNSGTTKMESAATVLSSSVNELNALPASLGVQMNKSRQAWAEDIAGNQNQYLGDFRQLLAEHSDSVRKTLSELQTWQADRAEAEDRWRDQIEASQAKRTEAEARRRKQQVEQENERGTAVLQLVNATTDVVSAVERLPQEFGKAIDLASNSLGRAFGQEAGNQVTDLIDAMSSGNEGLRKHLEGHVHRLLSELGDIVQQGLGPALKGISSVEERIEAAAEQLREAIGDFARHGRGFEDSLLGAAGTIDASSAQLGGAHEATRTSMDEIQEQYRAIHGILRQSVAKLESLLDDLEAARRSSRTRRFLTWIGSMGRSDDRGESRR